MNPAADRSYRANVYAAVVGNAESELLGMGITESGRYFFISNSRVL